MKKWIKVEDELPSYGFVVWVTDKIYTVNGGYKSYEVIPAYYEDDKWTDFCSEQPVEFSSIRFNSKVIAWMKIEKPEPYKEES